MSNQLDHSQWKQLVNSTKLSDVTFAVGSEATTIYGHRSLIAAASDVFFRMFVGDLAPSQGAPVEVPDIAPETFIEMIKFIYYDEPNVEDDNVVLLYYVAEKYNLDRLKERCLQFIINHEDSMLRILKNNTEYGFESIYETCLEILGHNPIKFFNAPEFMALPLDVMRQIANQHTLRCNTKHLVDALERWEQHPGEDRQGAVDQLNAIIGKRKQQSRYFRMRKCNVFGTVKFDATLGYIQLEISAHLSLKFTVKPLDVSLSTDISPLVSDGTYKTSLSFTLITLPLPSKH
ncbi:BTB/POZ domain-containing protein 1-like [Armigeres subalbatus]|uniref:BTB/POZ domain-containing protein 1-like n=1 Tax=Armigeres subalbatus TaxID=124917 RepID=UPI002ED420F7